MLAVGALGVRLPIHVQQLRRVDVRVALRGAQARMAEQLLDRPKVGAALQQVRRKGVAQRMRADARARAERGHVASHQPIDAAYGEPSAAVVHEERISRP